MPILPSGAQKTLQIEYAVHGLSTGGLTTILRSVMNGPNGISALIDELK